MIAHMFALSAIQHAERVAVICGGRQITYRDLDIESNRVARWMLSNRFMARHRAGICGPNSIEWVIAFLAIIKARGTPVNINHRYTRAELQATLDDAVLRWLFYADDLAAVSEVYAPEAEMQPLSTVNGRTEDPAPISWGIEPFDPEYVIYTGGTTGKSKGVVWRQDDLIAAHLPPVMPPNTILTFAPLSHGTAQMSLLAMLRNGGTLVLSDRSFSAEEMIRLINVHDARVAIVTGDVMARPFLETIRRGSHGKPGFVLASAGALLSEDVRIGLTEVGVTVLDSYGSTETGRGGTSDGRRRFWMEKDFRVLVEEEDDTWRYAEPGEIGRIARRGLIPLGYLNDPILTMKHFIDHDGDRWFVTNDAARREVDGFTTLLGRVDTCINTGGMKVWADEVEEVIRSKPGVEDAIVYGRRHLHWGECVACVYVGDVEPDDIEFYVRARLAGFKVPKVWERMEALPRTEAGKPDYVRLPR